jgi:hypothetical protein
MSGTGITTGNRLALALMHAVVGGVLIVMMRRTTGRAEPLRPDGHQHSMPTGLRRRKPSKPRRHCPPNDRAAVGGRQLHAARAEIAVCADQGQLRLVDEPGPSPSAWRCRAAEPARFVPAPDRAVRHRSVEVRRAGDRGRWCAHGTRRREGAGADPAGCRAARDPEHGADKPVRISGPFSVRTDSGWN